MEVCVPLIHIPEAGIGTIFDEYPVCGTLDGRDNKGNCILVAQAKIPAGYNLFYGMADMGSVPFNRDPDKIEGDIKTYTIQAKDINNRIDYVFNIDNPKTIKQIRGKGKIDSGLELKYVNGKMSAEFILHPLEDGGTMFTVCK